MLWLCWGTLPGLSSLTKLNHQIPKQLGSALQSKGTLTCTVEPWAGWARSRSYLEGSPWKQGSTLTQQPSTLTQCTSSTDRQTICQTGYVENKDLSSWKSHGTVSSLRTELGGRNLVLESPHLTLNSCPATHMDMPISPVLSQSSPS